MRANFTQCRLQFSANTSDGAALRAQWGWNGTVVGISPDAYTQISKAGCLRLCGHGMDNYPWRDVSSTLTTWILPVVGTLLQAPFESNAAKRTFLAVARWVGSPIASLSCILWNIKVSAKAALMVDMAVQYDETPDRKTDFGSMRDSLFLLLVMNQYAMKPTAVLREKEAEGLLRIVLFSKDLKLTDTDKTLRQMRRILAREVREMRRRGAVPVFVSTMWFLFAFALSIQAAFGALGQNATAHDLALGCLLAWFPVLILGSIVDRNPIAAEALRKKLNSLVDHVRHALRDEHHRNEFIDSFRDQPEFEQLKEWVQGVAAKSDHMYDFFVDFAGQARVRWHYGAAHPILSDIENCYIAGKGRNWLANEKEARANLVLGPVNDEGLIWFDIREFWQVGSAIIIVMGSCGGAFVLSFFTPTVGLGCRSGGYTIFFSITLGLLIVEMVVWLILSPYEVEAPWLTTFTKLGDDAHDGWRGMKRMASSMWETIGGFFTKCIVGVVVIFPWKDRHEKKEWVEEKLDATFRNWRDMTPHRKWEIFFFRPIEIFNSIWLIYIVLAQTFGWYKTCKCITSTWGGKGGYLDFGKQDTSNSRWVLYYWTTGTVMTALVLGISMFYMTVEWCQQSFLSTEDYEDAMQGLKRTRAYRRYTFPIRLVSRKISQYTIDPIGKLFVIIGLIKMEQKTILWTRKHTWNPSVTPGASGSHFPNASGPSFELAHYDSAAQREEAHDDAHRYDETTPAMPHSIFPSALVTSNRQQRARQGSDSPLLSPVALRPSSESERPLLHRRPISPSSSSMAAPQTYYYPESHLGNPTASSPPPPRTSQDSRLSFEAALSPTQVASPAEIPHHAGTGWLGLSSIVQSRQGYRRADSEPGSPPSVSSPSGAREMGGLGISFEERERSDEGGLGR